MFQTCATCGRRYNDEHEWTLCPHNPLEGGPNPGDYCRRHDFFGPCRVCAGQQAKDARQSAKGEGAR